MIWSAIIFFDCYLPHWPCTINIYFIHCRTIINTMKWTIQKNETEFFFSLRFWQSSNCNKIVNYRFQFIKIPPTVTQSANIEMPFFITKMREKNCTLHLGSAFCIGLRSRKNDIRSRSWIKSDEEKTNKKDCKTYFRNGNRV